MKIILTQDEMKEIITESVTDRYKKLIGNDQIKEIKNLGNSYDDVEIILITPKEIEAKKEA